MHIKRLITVIISTIFLNGCSPFNLDESTISKALFNSRFNISNEDPQLICKNDESIEPNKFQKWVIFETRNFCPGNDYTLYSINLDGKSTQWNNLIVDDNQALISEHTLKNFKMALNGFMPGEEVYFFLISEDYSHCAAAIAVPSPIEAKWNDNAYISVSSISPTMDHFIALGRGFTPNEIIVGTSKSHDEVLSHSITIDSDGQFAMSLLPAVKGQTGGVFQLIYERKATGETKILEGYYGTDAKLKR